MLVNKCRDAYLSLLGLLVNRKLCYFQCHNIEVILAKRLECSGLAAPLSGSVWYWNTAGVGPFVISSGENQGSVFLIQDLFQQLHRRQQIIICYCTMCLLNASASTWPSSGRSSTEEINNGKFCWRRAYDMIYLLTAIGLTASGSSTVHIYTQTIHRTTQTNNT